VHPAGNVHRAFEMRALNTWRDALRACSPIPLPFTLHPLPLHVSPCGLVLNFFALFPPPSLVREGGGGVSQSIRKYSFDCSNAGTARRAPT